MAHLLFDRKPPLSTEQKGALIDSLNKMLAPGNSYSKLATEMNKPEADVKKELVISALHDIAAPEDISQGTLGSCAATTVQIKMAIQNPGKYLAMIDDMAKGKEHVTGMKPNYTFKDEGKDDSKLNTYRTLSCKLMQNTLMDFADGARRAYDSSSKDKNLNYGLWDNEVKDLRDTIFNGTTNNVYSTGDYSPKQMVAMIDQAGPSSSNPIQISMLFNNDTGGDHANHVVSVVGIDKTKQTATIINPWGREETLPLKVLQDRILSIVADKELGTPRMEPADFSRATASKDDLIRTINDKNEDFLSKLTLSQKGIIVANLAKSANLSEQDKSAIIKVMGSILQGSDMQDSLMGSALYNGLLANGVNVPELINSIKANPDFINIAGDLCKLFPKAPLTAELINDPQIGPKLLAKMSTEDKGQFIGNILNSFPAEGPAQQAANNALTALGRSLEGATDFNMAKLVNNLSVMSKATMIKIENPAINKLFSKLTFEQKADVFRQLAKEQYKLDTALPTYDASLATITDAGMKVLQGMLDGKSQAEKAEIMKKFVTAYGQNDGKTKTPAQALADGKDQIVDVLPKTNVVTELMKLVK
jgi:hypothetical protein